MHLTMLGDSYQYAFAPAQGDMLRANGKGYVQGLGAFVQPTATDDIAITEYMNLHPEKSYADAYTYILGVPYEAPPSVDWSKVQQNATAFTTVGTQAGLSIAQIIAAIRGHLPATTENQSYIQKLQLQQYIPWAIGGAAVLIGLMFVMGTRRRR